MFNIRDRYGLEEGPGDKSHQPSDEHIALVQVSLRIIGITQLQFCYKAVYWQIIFLFVLLFLCSTSPVSDSSLISAALKFTFALDRCSRERNTVEF